MDEIFTSRTCAARWHQKLLGTDSASPSTVVTPFEAKLAKRIDEEIVRLRESMETRGVVQSFEDYRYLIGQIDALKRVQTSYFDEVNEDLNKEK